MPYWRSKTIWLRFNWNILLYWREFGSYRTRFRCQYAHETAKQDKIPQVFETIQIERSSEAAVVEPSR